MQVGCNCNQHRYQNENMRVTLISGFLGSGKTTLLRRLVHEAADQRLGVIVNDMSELEVDGDLVRDPELYNEQRGNFVSLTAGSISGSQRAAFTAVLDVWQHRKDLDHIVIETSGSTQPWALIEDIAQRPALILDTFATLVDAKAFAEDFACGKLVREALAEAGGSTPAHLMAAQLQLASVVLVSKTDRVTKSQLDLIAQHLVAINATAPLLAVSYGKIAPQHLLGTAGFDLSRALELLQTQAPAGECDIGSTVISDPRPLHPRRLWTLFRERLGLGIYRSKGFLWFPSRDRDVLLWNQAAASVELELSALWKAGLIHNPDGKLVREEIATLKEMLQGGHPIFGDRGCDLTVIGTAKDRAVFVRELHDCFCTADEITAWQQGVAFDDPWPKTLRVLHH